MGKKEHNKHTRTQGAFLYQIRMGALVFLSLFLVSCSKNMDTVEPKEEVIIDFGLIDEKIQEQEAVEKKSEDLNQTESTNQSESTNQAESDESAKQNSLVTIEKSNVRKDSANTDDSLGYLGYQGNQYRIIQVDGGDTSGVREALVAVDIGYGDRIYWGLTNSYGQLVYVLADEIILQDDSIEAVNENGRYYDEEAFVTGTELEEYDQGHVIADSLGGVANAYNITPQNSTLNRSGDQAYMEKSIHYGGGCKNFVAEIFYSDTKTQIPSHYMITYTLRGNDITEAFKNEEPQIEPQVTVKTQEGTEELETPVSAPQDVATQVAAIDTNGDGQVTIKEARTAGFQMPIYSNHLLYPYMHDGDGDGKVGE